MNQLSQKSLNIWKIYKIRKRANYLLNSINYIKYDPIERYYNTKNIINNIENLN